MSKKHFIALAEYLRDTNGYCEPFTPAQLEHLANFCHSQNCPVQAGTMAGLYRGQIRKEWGCAMTNHIQVSVTDPLIRRILRATFPSYRGRKIRIAPQRYPLNCKSYCGVDGFSTLYRLRMAERESCIPLTRRWADPCGCQPGTRSFCHTTPEVPAEPNCGLFLSPMALFDDSRMIFPIIRWTLILRRTAGK